MAYREDLENGDPHEEIVRLEEHIEELAAKIESCRKFILASRIAVAGGGVVLAAMLVGAIWSDLEPMAAAVSFFARRHCCMGFKQQHRKRGGEGDSRGRNKARRFDRTHQSARHLVAQCVPAMRKISWPDSVIGNPSSVVDNWSCDFASRAKTS